jgi:hypothetical protein
LKHASARWRRLLDQRARRGQQGYGEAQSDGSQHDDMVASARNASPTRVVRYGRCLLTTVHLRIFLYECGRRVKGRA